MAKIKGISKEIDDMSQEERLELAKTQRLKSTGKRKSPRGVGITSKKQRCIHCGSKNVEHACSRCAKKDKKTGKRINNICFTHAVFLDIGTTLENYSALGLNEFKEHPSMILCSCVKKGKIEGCASSVINAMKKEL